MLKQTGYMEVTKELLLIMGVLYTGIPHIRISKMLKAVLLITEKLTMWSKVRS